MDNIEDQLTLLLKGEGIEEEAKFCDFSISDQNEQLASKGVAANGNADFIPVTKKSVTYIVAGVLINENGEVLMMQEAKKNCHGQWYLPAGRVEPGETLYEAVKREVLEETGLEMKPSTLLMVESAAGSWFRYVLTGTIVGGKLKTTAEADSESLQAQWVKDYNQLHLRAKDIVPLIEKGIEYHSRKDEAWHSNILPSLIPHSKLYMRFVIVARKKSNNRANVLVSEKDHVHLPLMEINPQKSLHSLIKKYMNEIFGSSLPQHAPRGILSLEYSGKPGQGDGVCLNILISVRDGVEDVLIISKYSWLEISEASGSKLIQQIGKNLTIPLHVIR